jgi:hypothetical protein
MSGTHWLLAHVQPRDAQQVLLLCDTSIAAGEEVAPGRAGHESSTRK